MLILYLYTDILILSLFDHVDCDNKLLQLKLKLKQPSSLPETWILMLFPEILSPRRHLLILAFAIEWCNCKNCTPWVRGALATWYFFKVQMNINLALPAELPPLASAVVLLIIIINDIYVNKQNLGFNFSWIYLNEVFYIGD